MEIKIKKQESKEGELYDTIEFDDGVPAIIISGVGLPDEFVHNDFAVLLLKNLEGEDWGIITKNYLNNFKAGKYKIIKKGKDLVFS